MKESLEAETSTESWESGDLLAISLEKTPKGESEVYAFMYVKSPT
jgi:hypothetical protein